MAIFRPSAWQRPGVEGAALEPFKKAPLFNTDEKSVGADLDGIGLQLITFPIRVAAIAEMELQVMDRADDMAGAIDITVHHRGAGMGADVGEAIPPTIETRDAELFTVSFHFGYAAGSPFNICFLLREFIPLDLFEAH